MAELVPVQLPSGDIIQVESVDLVDGDVDENGLGDVSLSDTVVQVLQVSNFVETVQGVLSTVRMAVDSHRPDTFAVEFGVEINAKTGRVLSVLAEAGGKVHVKITATWERARGADIEGSAVPVVNGPAGLEP